MKKNIIKKLYTISVDADDNWLCAELNISLQAEESKLSTGWASSAKIWTDESSFTVIVPLETKTFLTAPSFS